MRLQYLVEAKSWQSVADSIAVWARPHFEYGWGRTAAEKHAIGEWPGERMPHHLEIDGFTLKRIGRGSSRRAYRISGTNVVAKIGMRSYNRAEYRYYLNADSQRRRFLAKSIAISSNGLVLLMQYVPNPSKREDMETMKKTNPRRFDRWSGNVRRTAAGHPKMIDYAE